MVTVPVRQLGLRFELGNMNGKFGCSKLEDRFKYMLGRFAFCFLRMEKEILARINKI